MIIQEGIDLTTSSLEKEAIFASLIDLLSSLVATIVVDAYIGSQDQSQPKEIKIEMVDYDCVITMIKIWINSCLIDNLSNF